MGFQLSHELISSKFLKLRTRYTRQYITLKGS